MDNTDNIEFENRLFLLTIIGKDLSEILEDFDKLYDSFFKDYKEEVIQYGNSIFFVSNKKTENISEEFAKDMGDKFAYVLIDITDNLNKYDFKGNVTKSHAFSERFVKLVKRFLLTAEEVEEDSISIEEELQIAIDNEDYEKASELRDKMKLVNSK